MAASGYPPPYKRLSNFAQDSAEGLESPSPSGVDAEFNSITVTVNQLREFLIDFMTPDRKLRLENALREMDLLEQAEYTIDGTNQTTETFADMGIDDIDATTDQIRMLTGADFETMTRIAPSELTVTDTDVTYPSQTIGTKVLIETYTGGAGVLVQLADIDTSDGADGSTLVGWGDENNRATNPALPVPTAVFNQQTATDILYANVIAIAEALFPVIQFVHADGSVRLTGNWLVNDRTGVATETAATGQISFSNQPNANDTVILNDGTNVVTFEFDVDVTIGAATIDTINSLKTAIDASIINFTTVTNDTGAPTALITFANNTPGTAGNKVIAGLDTATVQTPTGMSGGTDLATIDPLTEYFRLRNIPPSLRDGDVVVHEQLQALLQTINDQLAIFFRTDGSSTMSDDADIGGNKLINVAPGVDTTDGVNKKQMDVADTALDNEKIDLRGSKTGGADETQGKFKITGPLSLEALADGTAIADAEQVTDPDAVTVQTMYKVPQGNGPAHLVNLLQVQNIVAASTSRVYGNGELGDVAISNQTEADAIFTGPGLYNFNSLIIDGPITLPYACNIRSLGVITINVAILIGSPVWFFTTDIATRTDTAPMSRSYIDYGLAEAAGFRFPVHHEVGGAITTSGFTNATTDTLGGSAVGLTGDGANTHRFDSERLAAARTILTLSPFVGQAGQGGKIADGDLVGGNSGGGGLMMTAFGNMDFTGATFTADGVSDPAAFNYGGSSGGCLMFICRGTLTAGTYNATGSDAKLASGVNDHFGGGGGYIAFVATTLSGTQTTDVTGGANAGIAGTGGVGLAESITTLTAAQIDGLEV